MPELVKQSAQTTPAETTLPSGNIMSMFPTLTPVIFTAGTGQDGVTGFEQLLMRGAVVELSMHVDTIGGGAPGLADGVYYRPNRDLEFIDRLPDTGTVHK